MAWANVFNTNAPVATGTHSELYSETLGADSTGSDLLVIAVSWLNSGAGGGTITSVQDTYSNTWNALTEETQGVNSVKLFWCKPTTLGSGHKFRCNASAISYLGIAAVGFSGSAASPADAEDGAQSDSAATLTGLTITPSESGCMVVTGLTRRDGGTLTVPTGFTLSTQEDWDPTHASIAIAYKEHTSGAISPEWVQASATRMVARVAAFKLAGGGGGGSSAGAAAHYYRQLA